MSRADVGPIPEDPTDEQLRQSLVESISGLRPAMTGGLCDSCNAGFVEGDRVLVTYWLRNGRWHAVSTICDDHGADIREGKRWATNAVVRCELGAEVQGEFFPLYNPDVIGLENNGRS